MLGRLRGIFVRVQSGRGRTVTVALAVALPTVLVGLWAVQGVRSISGGSPGGISQERYAAVRKGQSESSVETLLGRPLTQQEAEYDAPIPAGDACIYYFDSSGALQGGSTYRLCFKGGLLDFKDGSGSDFPPPPPT